MLKEINFANAEEQIQEARHKFKKLLSFFEDPKVQFISNILGLILYFVVGCCYYHAVEGWSIGATVNFTIVTMSTVGYGYKVPTTDESRLFTIFYMIFGIYFIFFTISSVITQRLIMLSEYIKGKLKDNNFMGHGISYHKRMIVIISFVIVACIFIGSAIFQALEGWTFITALYFTVQTATTVGYGDIPVNGQRGTRAAISIYIIISTILFAFAFNSFTMLEEERKLLLKKEALMNRRKELHVIGHLDKGEGVTENHFILAILEHIGVVDYEKDIKPWQDEFNKLDVHRTGRVSRAAIEEFSAREAIAAEEAIQEIQENLGRNSRSSSRSSSVDQKSTFTISPIAPGSSSMPQTNRWTSPTSSVL